VLLAREANRGLFQHVKDSICGVARSLFAPGWYRRKVTAGIAALAVASFFFGSLPYRLTVPCVVTASKIRHVAAPADGILTHAHVVDGDRVRQGEVLCEFDQRDIEQELTKLNAELEVLEREEDRAMAADLPADVQLAQAKQQLLRAKIAIARRRGQRAVLRAPFDGVVVSGDLRKMVGGVVLRGEPLYQIAPLDQWRLELETPQSNINDLADGLSGVFLCYARPEEARAFSISRVLGTAQVRDGNNVFVAEADIRAVDDHWLRPGMEGVAKINVGQRRIWWLALHKIIDYARMGLWV
jgi:multidrug resistance efflux pump